MYIFNYGLYLFCQIVNFQCKQSCSWKKKFIIRFILQSCSDNVHHYLSAMTVETRRVKIR